MNFSILLSEGPESLVYGSYVWTFALIFVGVVVIGWVASAMGWLYTEKVEEKPTRKSKNSH